MPSSGGNVNAPESGTYGEGAALERLQSDLPTMDPTQPSSPGSGGGTGAPPYQGAAAPAPGLPPSILAPSNQPDVPVTSPLQSPLPAPQDPPELRILKLQQLQQEGTEETRQWATLWLNRLIRAARQ